MALLRTPPTDDPEGTENVLRAVQWMLSASLRRAARPPGLSDPKGGRIGKAQMYVLDHIADPNLDPDELASALHMSRRALYVLFKEYRMTPGRMIHDLRLERCQKALCDRSQESRSVTEIAFDNGFQDAATFSRLFKAQYGMAPSDCRRKALGRSGHSAQSGGRDSAGG
jgi:AraC family transcriptional activator of tynA and feaB